MFGRKRGCALCGWFPINAFYSTTVFNAAPQILRHDWLVKEGAASDVVLDSVVLKRLRQFAQMNKLKKMCLMVVGQHLSPEEIAGKCQVVK